MFDAKEIERFVGVRYNPSLDDWTVNAFAPVASARSLGWEGVFMARLFPSVRIIEQFESSQTLPLPGRCCVCYKPGAAIYLPRPPLSFLDRVRRALFSTTQYLIPHCTLHGQRAEAQFLMKVYYSKPYFLYVKCMGLSQEFLEDFRIACSVGDMFPPWYICPHVYPELGWQDSSPAYEWRWLGWNPFWTGLSQAERVSYCERWNAPADWREALLTGIKETELFDWL